MSRHIYLIVLKFVPVRVRNPRTTRLVALCRALADRTRLRILNLLGPNEVCVCFLVEVIGGPQARISRHLAYLRRAGIVSARRLGKWMQYRVVEPPEEPLAGLFRAVRDSLATDPELQRDQQRLERLCCASRAPIQILRAPKPARVA